MLSAISNYINEVIRGKKLRVGGHDAQWRKVADIKVGDKIAITNTDFEKMSLRGEAKAISSNDVEFDEIVSIKRLSPERVYDIEVEGTHNFVAGHFIDTPSPATEALLTDEPGRGPPQEELKIPRTRFGGIFAHNTYAAIFNGGNVGIGLTNPAYKLDVSGDVNLTGALRASGNAGSSGYLLNSTGTTVQWSSAAALGLSNYWVQTSGGTTGGLLYPGNNTVDMAIGGTSTSSAKFAFMNVNSGNPTASISGNLGLVVPTGSNPSTLFNVLNGGSLNFQTATTGQGDVGLNTRLYIGNNGNIGIGSTSPTQSLYVNGNIASNVFYDTSSTAYYLDPGNGATSLIINGAAGIGTTSPQSKFDVAGSVSIGSYGGSNSAPTNGLIVSGNVGIGTTAPGYKLDVQGTGNFLDTLTLTGSGDTTYNINSWQAIGRYAGWDANMLYLDGYGGFTNGVSVGSPGAPSTKFQVYGGTSYFGGNVGIGTTTVSNKLDVNGNMAIGSYAGTSAPSNSLIISGNVGIGNTSPAAALDVTGSLNVSKYATVAASLAVGTSSVPGGVGNAVFSGNVGIGITNPSYRLHVNGTMAADVYYDTSSSSYYLDAGNGGTSLVTNGDATIGGNATIGGGSGKITVGTVDPPYTINGKKYATYTSGITGVKEETTGTANVSEYVPGVGYKYTLDFNAAPEGSDLWLFSKVTNLKDSLNNLVALLSPKDNARTWYTTDVNNFTATIYSSRPTTVAYRLTAPRFDSSSWSNNRTDNATGFVINDQGNVVNNQTSIAQNTQPTPPQIVSGSPDVVYNGNLVNNSQFPISTSFFSASNFQSIFNDQIYNVQLQSGEIVDEVTTATHAFFGKITAGFIETENALVNNTLVAKNIIAQNISGLNSQFSLLYSHFIVADQKIVSPVIETQDITATGTAQLNTVATNEIKPQNGDLTINLAPPANQKSTASVDKGALARLIITGLQGKTAAVIDAAGNATFSGTLAASDASISGTLAAGQINSQLVNSQSVNSQTASISGTLIAGNIQSDNINSLTRELVNSQTDIASQSSTLAQLTTNNQSLTTNINDIQKLLADIKNQPMSDLTNQTNITNLTNLSSISVNPNSTPSSTIANNSSPAFDQLTVTGQTNLYNVSISGSLLAGTTMIDNTGILSLASNLNLSSLSTITLFNGSVVIAKDGTITTEGTLVAQGGVRTNTIQPLDNNSNIAVELNSKPETLNANQITNNKLQITNNGNEVASIDASGSAYFKNGITMNKYMEATQSAAVIAAADNFNQNGIYAPAIQTQAQTAGVGILPSNQQEVIIYNDSVKNNSLIYITPTTSNSSQLTVSQKVIGNKSYFVVTTNTGIHPDIQFNWLIIN